MRGLARKAGGFGSMSVSEQLCAYPSLNPTLTLTCNQLTVVGLVEGWVCSCSAADTDPWCFPVLDENNEGDRDARKMKICQTKSTQQTRQCKLTRDHVRQNKWLTCYLRHLWDTVSCLHVLSKMNCIGLRKVFEALKKALPEIMWLMVNQELVLFN